MNPHLTFLKNDNSLDFTLSGLNVSLANAFRRTILSDIPLVVFRTTPNDKNKCNITANTSRLNNEIIKQRISSIPIFIKDVDDFPLKNYIMELNVENTTDTVMIVTTENFTIKDLISGNVLSKDKTREIFPPDDTTGYFIDLVRLRPKMSEEMSGEKIVLTCEFEMGTAKEDGMFNSVYTCSYGFTPDIPAQDAALVKKIQTWKDEGKTEKEIIFETDNWRLLDAKRIYIKDSYDFIIQSVGIYTNNETVDFACKILIDGFNNIDSIIEKDELEIKTAENTMSNCFDIILENEDYTIGKVLEYLLYIKFYETHILTYCGFKKLHPHDTFSIIRVAYKNSVDKSTIKGNLKECIEIAISIYSNLKTQFSKMQT